MITEVQRLMDDYWAWLKARTSLRQIGDYVEITTPYLDRHNDYFQIYAKQTDGGLLLTDDGYTIGDLERSGFTIESPKRQRLLDLTLNGFGVTRRDNALEVRTSRDAFSLRKHNLLQAMLAVNDLFYMAPPTVESLFLEDVEGWLNLNDVRFSPKVKFTGKSGYDHMFDFLIPKSSKQPERLIRAINKPSRDSAEALAFSWIDTKTVRPPESRAFAILNDSERTVAAPVLDALRSYDVTAIGWSRRDDVISMLAQ